MIKVQEEDFSIENEMNALRNKSTDIGAIVSFTGLVRGTVKKANSPDKTLISMELEHYPGMTEKELYQIEEQAKARWPLTDCLIIHRIGKLLSGDQIVLVLTASAHRHAAFEAGQFIMDFLKTKATFWKKEAFSDGTSNWVDARDSDTKALKKWSENS